jgi:hypothetical protein
MSAFDRANGSIRSMTVHTTDGTLQVSIECMGSDALMRVDLNVGDGRGGWLLLTQVEVRALLRMFNVMEGTK